MLIGLGAFPLSFSSSSFPALFPISLRCTTPNHFGKTPVWDRSRMEHRLLRRLKALILRWRRQSRSGKNCWILPKLCLFFLIGSLGEGIPFVKSFTYKQIDKATSGFGVILESGPQGTIYKAQFSNGLFGSVRRVRSHQLQKNSFLKNVQLLGRLHHRHLVSLKGFCEGKDRFLVFDYMENGRLKDYLHDPLKTPLNWRTRLQIAIDIAAALEYLQYFCEPPIYNLSISSNNILLDENFVAKLSDVGFVDCDFICNGESNITSSEDNTEQRNKRLVFQFGMLLLELITGQSLLNEAEIVHWIQESGFAYSIHKMVDTDLGDSYDSKELGSLLVVARLCTKADNDTSISIPQILRFLQGHIGHSTL